MPRRSFPPLCVSGAKEWSAGQVINGFRHFRFHLDHDMKQALSNRFGNAGPPSAFMFVNY
jgi:hypothetical protein